MSLLTLASFVAALGCGLVGGVFYAFSTFVMRALGQVPAAEGARAMQAINETVLTPWFLVVFVGLAPVCAGLAVAGILAWDRPGSPWLVASSLVYVIGTFAQTRIVHIPMNDRLADLDAGADDGQIYWQQYLRRWTAWNHVRTAAALIAAALFTLALMA